MTDDRLGAGLEEWREAFEAARSDGSPDCPGDERLAALALGELSGDERRRFADHVVACRRCSESYRALRELDREAGRPPRSAAGRRWAWALAAAASVLVAAWLAGGSWRVPTERTAPVPDVVRSADGAGAVAPAPDAELDAAPSELSWARAPGARYRVRLFDAAATPMWERSGLRLARAELPDEVRSRLAPGESFFWVVEVDGPGGSGRLGPYWFRVIAPR